MSPNHPTSSSAPTRARFLLPLLAALLIVSPVRGLDLLFEQDAWALGMGGAGAASAGGTHAVLINPAGISSANVPMIQIGGVFRPEAFSRGGHLVALFPTHDRTVFGLTLLQDQIPGVVRNRAAVASAALPLQSNGDLRIGFNVKLIGSRAEIPAVSTANGLSLDLGWVYDWRLRNGDALSLALVAHDLTGSVRRSPGLDEEVSRSFTFGLAYQDIPRMRIEADFQVVDRTLSPTSMRNRVRLGVERFLSQRRYSARLGYDDIFGDLGFITLGAGWHPDRPFEIQVAGGFSEKEMKPMASFSAVYRFDRWRVPGRSAQGAPEIEVGGDETPTALATGRPVSGTPLQKIAFSVNPRVISPNGDGQEDAALVSLIGPSHAGSGRWEAEFRLSGAKAVRKFGGSGSPPSSFTWDGRGEDGKPVADGRYEVVLRTFEPTGVLTSEDTQPLEVRSILAVVSLSAEPAAFSPNGDQVRDETILRWKGDPAFVVSGWDWSVSQKEGGRAVYSARGKGPLPARLAWDGRGTDGSVVPDGVYRVKLSVREQNGKILSDESNPITLDTLAPSVSTDLKPGFVAPAKTPVRALLRAEDAVGVVAWKVIVRDEWGRPFKTDSGTPPFPKTWVWDGASDRGGATAAAPGAFFSVVFEAADAAGNRGQTTQVALQMEPEIATGNSQQMSLNLATVFFDDRSASLGEEAVKELRGAVESIRPYLAKSTLRVLGYADVTETGDPILTSHARAAAVRDFLARELRVEPASISVVGYGTRDPLSTPAGPAPPEKQRRAVVTLVTTP